MNPLPLVGIKIGILIFRPLKEVGLLIMGLHERGRKIAYGAAGQRGLGSRGFLELKDCKTQGAIMEAYIPRPRYKDKTPTNAKPKP